MIKGGPSIVKNGLTFCVDFADASSYVSGAATVYNNAGSETGSVTYGGSGGFSTNAFGSLNCAATGYVTFGTSGIFSFGSPSFSVGAWCYFDGTSQTNNILGKREDAPNFEQYSMGIMADIRNGGLGTRFGFFTGYDGGSIYSYGDYDLAPTGAGWYYGIFTVDTLSQLFYINAVQRVTGGQNFTGRTFNIPGRNFLIGAINIGGSPGGIFKSLIGHVHIYNRPLTAIEVAANYNALKERFGRT